MTIRKRLQADDSFTVDPREAQQFLEDDAAVQFELDTLTDFYDAVGCPQTRSATIRELHPELTAKTPLLDRRAELLEDDRFVHPFLLDALDDADELERRVETLERYRQRVDEGKLVDTEMLSILLDRPIDYDQNTIRAVDGTKFHSEHWHRSYEGVFIERTAGSSALYSADDARELLTYLPLRLLRRRARLMVEDQAMSAEEKAAAVGVDALIEADPHFRDDELVQQALEADDEMGKGERESDPRREKRPGPVIA